MTEEWRPVVGFEGTYEVSDAGQVKSVPHATTYERGGTTVATYGGRILKGWLNQKGYRSVGLSHGPRCSTRLVHRLVLEAFVGPCPKDMEGCHNNGDKSNNSVSNLRWDTPKSNQLDKIAHGANSNLNKTHCPYGHGYDQQNTLIRTDGGRACRTCIRIRKRASDAKKRELRA